MEKKQFDAQLWDARYAAEGYQWKTEPNQFVARELAGLPPGRALDLAAGEGRNSVWLASRGWQVTAVDFSRVGLDKGRKLADQSGVTVDWVVADLLDYEPPTAQFDLVVIAYLQLPASQAATVLHRAATALADGGTLFFVAHAKRNLTDGVGGPQDPDVLYTPEGVSAEIPGLRVLRAEDVSREVGDAEAIDTLVRAVRLPCRRHLGSGRSPPGRYCGPREADRRSANRVELRGLEPLAYWMQTNRSSS